jgi:phosphatidylserine decarboxylase
VSAGQRCGLIRFGSRAALDLLERFVPLVHEGQRAIAGETALAALPRTEAPRRESFITQ